MTTKIKTFVGSINEIDTMIANWISGRVEIISTSESMVVDNGMLIVHLTIVYKETKRRDC